MKSIFCQEVKKMFQKWKKNRINNIIENILKIRL